MTDTMTYKPLGRTGLEVSTISFGAAGLGEEYGEIDPGEGTRAVHYAIDHGINYFDTSPYYGRTLSETRLGEALAGGWREKVILATKVGRYDAPLETGFDFSPARIQRSVDESLQRLQTDYIDIFQLHDIEFWDRERIINEALPAAHELKASGKIRFLGITGYPVHMLRDVIERSPVPIDTVLTYCRYNLLDTTFADVLAPTLIERGVGIVNASTLHMRVLTEKGAPDWHPAPQRVNDVAQQAVENCKRQGANLPRLALQFALAYDPVATTCIGMSSVRHVDRNLEVLGTTPDPELLAAVQAILAPAKDVYWQSGCPENFDPGAVLPNS